MYQDGELQQDILDAFERHARDNAVIVASSMPVPARNDAGDNPPHAKAKARYLQIVDSAGRFVCTDEWPEADQPEPGRLWARRRRADAARPVCPRCRRARRSRRPRRRPCESAVPDWRRGRNPDHARRRGRGRPGAGGSAGGAPRRSRTAEPGLDRAQRAVTAARGRDAAPRQPVGFGGR